MGLGDLARLNNAERLEYYKTHGFNGATDNALAHNLERVRWLKGEHAAKPFFKFLDLGCHDGFITRWMLDSFSFGCLVGIDPNEQAIRAAELMLASTTAPEKGVYINSGFETVKLVTLFDGVSSTEMIEHFTQEEGEGIIKYMWDHLAPEGRGFICTPNIDGRWGRTNPDEHHINLFGMAHLLGTVQKVTGADPVPCGYKNECDFLNVRFIKP